MDSFFYIVLPVFNPVESYFREQVASIAAQTTKKLKVFFVNADLQSAKLIKSVAVEHNLEHTIFSPDQTLNSVAAFEYGLRHILDLEGEQPPFFIALCDQDDVWLPEKLVKLGTILERGKVDLVHSDAAIVDADNKLLHKSMFSLEKRDRRATPRALLYRNNVTGMTCAFTRAHAVNSLPFPRQNGLLFHHDLWLALVASVGNGLEFVNEPLVRYRQHGKNAVGAIMSKRPGNSRAGWRDRLIGIINSYYLANYLAKLLYQRAVQIEAAGTHINRDNIATLKPHLATFRPGLRFVTDSAGLLLRGKVQHARIAASFFVARMARVGWSAVQLKRTDFPDRVAEFDRRRFAVVPGVQPPALQADKVEYSSSYLGKQTHRGWSEFVDQRKNAQWKAEFRDGEEQAILLLVPTLNPTEMFAGIATAVDFGLALAERGHRVKFIAGDIAVNSPNASLSFLSTRLRDKKHLNRISIHCGVTSEALAVNRDDIFFATAWWTAHVARTMIKKFGFANQRFIYLIQDFEPNFYPWGDDFAGAMASYKFDYLPVFNTTLLRDYFIQQFNLNAEEPTIAFHPSIKLSAFTGLSRKEPGKRRKLAVYGRPEVSRNMFPTTVEALARFIVDNNLGPDDLECESVGMPHADIELPNGLKLKSIGKLPWADYPGYLAGVDIGMALMYSPHPSHLPLELAAAGARVVTNSFAQKDLSVLSPLIFSSEAETEALASALASAWADIDRGIPFAKEREINLEALGLRFSTAAMTLSGQIKNNLSPEGRDLQLPATEATSMEHKTFFMHVAKTAGSYMNELFMNGLGLEKVVVHGENKFRDHANFKRLVTEDGIEFFSGHIYFRLWQEFAKNVPDQFKLITVLRNPIDHIASHILWLDHYNLPEKKDEYNRLSEAHRRLVDLIGQVKFDDYGSLDHFITHLPPAGIQLLDNCQSRYFVCGPGSTVGNFDPITLAHSTAILNSYKQFDLVLIQSDLDAGISMVNSLLGTSLEPLKEKVNEAKSARKINTADPTIRSILSKRITVDSWLWRHSVAQNEKAKAKYGVSSPPPLPESADEKESAPKA